MDRIYEAIPIILTDAERTELEGLARSTKSQVHQKRLKPCFADQ